MLKNYFKSAIRFIRHNKLFVGINLLGLSVALAASFIILIFVINELSYDRYHKNSKQVYRVLNYYVDFKNIMSGTPYVLATALKNEFPQVEKAVCVRRINGFRLKVNDNIFTLPLSYGSSENNLLGDLNSIFLSHYQAEKLFPGQNPVGKEIVGSVNNKDQVFIIRGVFEDLPENSTFRAQ